MSRAVVYQAIVNSAALQAMGFDNVHILPNYDAEQRPTIPFSGTQQMFMTIMWGRHEIDPMFYRGPRYFNIWIHQGIEFGTDYGQIDNVIEILDPLLTGIVDTAGADGRSVTTIEMAGRSDDMQDPVYQTICRNTSYKMISRVTATAAE